MNRKTTKYDAKRAIESAIKSRKKEHSKNRMMFNYIEYLLDHLSANNIECSQQPVIDVVKMKRIPKNPKIPMMIFEALGLDYNKYSHLFER